ncbi:MAG: hypothetical protein QOJ40_442, partial [Verrucomicrobiota bacterium]
MRKLLCLVTLLFLGVVPGRTAEYDLLIRNGTIYDGSGKPPFESE